MINMRTLCCLMIVLSLAALSPLSAADSGSGSTGGAQPAATCYEVNIYNSPPVYVYECPDTDPLP